MLQIEIADDRVAWPTAELQHRSECGRRRVRDAPSCSDPSDHRRSPRIGQYRRTEQGTVRLGLWVSVSDRKSHLRRALRLAYRCPQRCRV
jgi:hypothetical protein